VTVCAEGERQTTSESVVVEMQLAERGHGAQFRGDLA
jgi:hypothetical protein